MRIRFMVLAALLCSGLAEAQQPDSGSFFVRLGSDTIAVERYVRTRQQLVAEAILRTPVTRHVKLTVTFNDRGNVTWWEVLNTPVAGVPEPGPIARVLTTQIGDSVQVESWIAARQMPTRKFAAGSPLLPLQIPFYSTYELAIQRARQNPQDTTLAMFAANGPITYEIGYPTPDSVTLFHPQMGTTRMRVDGEGRLLALDNRATTFKVQVTRSKPVDLQPWSVRFAKADAAGKSIGFLSPRDTVDVTVGEAGVLIDYSRPSKRGRTIFGDLVPWNHVWRTGANAATQLELDQPIEIQGTRIPAGKYSLWSLPSPNGWQIIINTQIRQWGTAYDATKDLARFPASTERLSTPVEQFTIAVEPVTETSGELTLSWDRTRVRLPFTVPQQ